METSEPVESLEKRIAQLETEVVRWKDLHEIYQGGAYREEDRRNAWKVRANTWKDRAEKAETRLRELTEGVRSWVQDTDSAPSGKHWARLHLLLCDYEEKS